MFSTAPVPAGERLVSFK
ncbi:hypothetical protein [Anabaena sp. FACHB-1237]